MNFCVHEFYREFKTKLGFSLIDPIILPNTFWEIVYWMKLIIEQPMVEHGPESKTIKLLVDNIIYFAINVDLTVKFVGDNKFIIVIMDSDNKERIAFATLYDHNTKEFIIPMDAVPPVTGHKHPAPVFTPYEEVNEAMVSHMKGVTTLDRETLYIDIYGWLNNNLPMDDKSLKGNAERIVGLHSCIEDKTLLNRTLDYEFPLNGTVNPTKLLVTIDRYSKVTSLTISDKSFNIRHRYTTK